MRTLPSGVDAARLGAAAALAVVGGVLAWLLFIALPSRYVEHEPPAPTTAVATTAPAQRAAPGEAAGTPDGTRRIAAQIFYVAENGQSLVGLEREVPFADNPVDQARAIVQAQIAPPEPPLVTAVPEGTTLRALFLTPRGEAYVDLSREITSAHSGGSIAELLTVYSIVHALTTNLPAITSVQILVDGREVDTLAGHVNLRRPFAPNPDWIQ